MKKVISSLLVASVLLFAHSANAANITVEQAKQAAAHFMSKYTKQASNITAADVTLVYQEDNYDLNVPAVYYLNVGDFSWIIMAATTVIDPVVAFSVEGTPLIMEDMPTNMRWLLDLYTQDIIAAQNLDAEKSLPDSPEWTEMANGTMPAPKGSKTILMKEYWEQGEEYSPTFNMFCPKIGDKYSVTGCVATALSQIYHYNKYPLQPGGGSVRYWSKRGKAEETLITYNFDTVEPYNYDLMPLRYTNGTSAESIREAARLCYAVGVSVHMQYSPDGSGTTDPYNIQGVNRYFGYPDAFIVRRNSTTDTSFYNTMLRRLLDKHILYMDGYSQGSLGPDAGHAWVCGGYWERTEGKYWYWMNWGWGYNINSSVQNGSFFNLSNGNGMNVMGYNYNTQLTFIDGMFAPEGTQRILDAEQTMLGTPYPNPATLTVTIPYIVDNASDLNLYSVDGKLVYTRTVSGSGDCTIDVSSLPAGIYIYRINSKSGKIMVQ